MALHLRLRTNLVNSRNIKNPCFSHFFSTQKSNNDDEPPSKADEEQPSPYSPPRSQFSSSHYGDIKVHLKQQHSTSFASASRRVSPLPSDSSLKRPSTTESLAEIRKRLSDFRLRTSVPPPSTDPNSNSSSSSQPISFQDLYKRNLIATSGESRGNADSSVGKPGVKISFDKIKESMRHLRSTGTSQGSRKGGDPLSLSAYKNSFGLKPSDSTGSGASSTVIGGTALPASIFGKEMKEKEDESSAATNIEFMKSYDKQELGEKLRALRPEAKGKDWFSLAELNERLIKLSEMEKAAIESAAKGYPMKELRASLMKLKHADEENKKQNTLQRLNILGQLGRTPSLMLNPPKDHLIEKYFRPDNMSSAEKIKLELAKVRDEFKMSESDCGSARVQVAQLTTKIKHLSSVLHKNDKHSVKGLLAMVQRRKKLLKYLRRTDWDSYCFVISRLGLRDNPDLKH